jgi:homocysteine S-methyltransferase
MTKTAFASALQCDMPLLLDGGMATQLEAQGCDISGALWSAAMLQSQPRAIVDAGLAYLRAGADCIGTASYQASREGFASVGVGADEADALMRSSVDLARQARDEYLAEVAEPALVPLIAASLGPYGAMLHDGSEYRGDYGVGKGVLREFHAQRLPLFDAAEDIDVLALETIPSLPEAEVLASLLTDCESPAWVSFSCLDAEHISDGTPIEDAVALFADHPTVLAVGINCTPPQFAPALIRRIRRAAPGKAAMAYPNSGETWNADNNAWTGTVTPLDCAAAALQWLDAGAKIVGGCCRMGPAHIRAMRDAIA